METFFNNERLLIINGIKDEKNVILIVDVKNHKIINIIGENQNL